MNSFKTLTIFYQKHKNKMYIRVSIIENCLGKQILLLLLKRLSIPHLILGIIFEIQCKK